ncbi:cytochrome bc1 complex Rieske iron-sulfur subunit [Actinoplanes regularis]|uniref:Cytochrome bc1 complex Rieske iron-sulfur subunit n=1 Tax=Actinoplanes regularis TaxID=52697 RepID=A0A238WJN7_9ACTN|nr:Rieske 2Fe-2S domain-containing protein [Actinoplanes regularis]GIE84809.1 ubiquinol-cytochrome c reductase iron-sulfur subunit [Actinoplanes regularis]GLW32429.1 ubiquinol-cytochrome c reductase iron-sulfur subunit [Actinoplanes regularis]SNR46782.1 menaquinol-cytochrome c reductase iron-sulfur subunit precursor [Actinoplanes regularis]
MSTAHHGGTGTPVDVNDPKLTRFDIVKEGLRRDDIEIVTYESQFQGANSKAEKRVVRNISLLFIISGLGALAFVVFYIIWPWRYELGNNRSDYFTPILGGTLGVSLFALGIGILAWAKKLLPHELSIQQRHGDPSSDEERLITGQTMMYVADELGVQRRPLLKGAIAIGVAPLGLAVGAPLVGGLIQNPHKDKRPIMYHTGFDKEANGGKPVRLTREDGSPIRPEDVSTGGQLTVYPGIPGGATNKYADSPTLLIHLRSDDAATARAAADSDKNGRNKGSMWGNYVAYSKICTHAGCPASLYEQQTNRLLCPCHQSQFLITDNAQPVFGPATRRLPMLPLSVDDEGFFVATSDFKDTVGPDFWERP